MKYKWLVLILLFGAVLRFIGIYPGYNQFHPDEQMSYFTAAAMIDENTFVPTNGYRVKFAYPYLVPIINFVFFKYFFIPIGWLTYLFINFGKIVDGFISLPFSPQEASRIFKLDILGHNYINTIFWARTVTAFFGVGNILLAYLISSKIANKRVGLIAAFLLAFNFRQITNSHIALPDIYNSFFFLLSVLFSINLYQNPSKKSYILAGIFTGLAFNVKFQFFGFAPLFVAHFLSNKRLFNHKIILSFLIIVLITLFINPYHLINFDETKVVVTDVALKYGMGTKVLNFFPVWYLFNIDLGPPLFILSMLGVFLGFYKRFKYSLIIFSVLAFQIFLFFYYSTGGFHTRNMIPMTPFILIFASFAIEKIYRKLPLHLFIFVLLLIIYVPTKNSIISDHYYTKLWNFNLLSEWLYKHPLDGPVASNPTDPPTGTPQIARTEFAHAGSFSMAEHIENGAKYALINTDWAGNEFYNWMIGHPGNLRQKWDKPISQLRNTYHGLALEEMLQYQIFASIKPWQAPEANLILTEFPDWSDVKLSKVFEKSGNFTTLKVQAKQDHLYKITADIKDGYLRANTGVTNCVSSRVNGNQYLKKTFYCLVPKGSSFIEISSEGQNLIVEESLDTVKIIPSKYPYIKNNVELELIYPNSHANL